VVVHLFEWSWKDIAKECENLSKWGYWGVQVSPPQEDVPGNQWWTRYQPVSYQLTSRSGTEEDFKAMVQTCKDQNVNVIVDAVINHMANPGKIPSEGRAGSDIAAKCVYPGLYQRQDFHHTKCSGGCQGCDNCDSAWSCGSGQDPSAWYNCNLGGLPDLDQSNPYVRDTIAGYLNHLVDLGVAGIRVDAAKHINPDQLSAILDKVEAPALFVNQEVILRSSFECGCLRNDLFYKNGKVWEFKTPMLFFDVFSRDGNMEKIKDMDSSNPGRWECPWAESDFAMTFVVNHDRLISKDDRPNTITIFNPTRYSLALIALLAHPYGQPNILSSINFDFNNWDGRAPVVDPNNDHSGLKSPFDGNCGYWKDSPMKPYACEHRWPEVRNMVMWRNVAGLGPAQVDVYNNNVLVITRGKAFAAINNGAAAFDQEMDARGLPAGTYCNVATRSAQDCYPCQASCPNKVTVRGDGKVQVQLPGYNALAFHANSMVPQRAAAEL